MKNIAMILLVSVMVIISGCATKSTNSFSDVEVDEVEREYILRARNPNPAPDWIRNFYKYKRSKSESGQHYYLGESGETSDRIAGCDLAIVEGQKKVGQEIATLISSKLASTKSGQLVIDKGNPDDPGMRRHFEQSLAAKSMAFLRGVKEVDIYWEERDYSKVGGKKRAYVCMALMKISDKHLKKALMATSRKAPEVTEDKQAKAVVKKELKDISKYFDAYKKSE
jgi:hypothetical protein